MFQKKMSHNDFGESVFSIKSIQMYQSDDAGCGLWIAPFGGRENDQDEWRFIAESAMGYLQGRTIDVDATVPFVQKPYYSTIGNVIYNSLWIMNDQILMKNEQRGIHERMGCSVFAYARKKQQITLGLCGLFGISSGMDWLSPPDSYVNTHHLNRNSGQDFPTQALGLVAGQEVKIIEVQRSLLKNCGIFWSNLNCCIGQGFVDFDTGDIST